MENKQVPGSDKTTDNVVITDIPFEIKPEEVLGALRMTRSNPSLEKTVDDLVNAARSNAVPKALFRVAFVDDLTDSGVVVDGVLMESSILRQNLQEVERVFPYIVTAGRELDTMETVKDDIMAVFCLDTIKEMILESAIQYFVQHIEKTFSPGKTAHMNPGSLGDWPIYQQRQVFSLFGDVESLIGVSLTESCLMNPVKSVSGILFPAEFDFKSCMLCTRHPCSKRKAKYNPEMVRKYKES